MASERAVLLHIGLLLISITGFAFVLVGPHWYACAFLLAVMAGVQVKLLLQRMSANDAALQAFLTAVLFDDVTRDFTLPRAGITPSLSVTLNRMMAQLRAGRAERAVQSHYTQALLAHMPVALLMREDDGKIQLLNPAARRLFGAPVATLDGCARYGQPFVTGLGRIQSGQSTLLTMVQPQGTWHLKASATAFASQGRRQVIISLQNIASELSAQELAAWQTVIRTMTHEVMNSLTPISSLSATAADRVHEARDYLSVDSPAREALDDAIEALDVVSRRSAGLMRFVQDHRRLSHRLTLETEKLSLTRQFSRLHRLFAAEMTSRGISFTCQVDPVDLEIVADGALIDQALINLLRNAMDAVRGQSDARIALTSWRNSEGHICLQVVNNGPRIPPEMRETIFVPFYTTKQQGTGVGLTLVRQIASVHGAGVSVRDTHSGETAFIIMF